MTLKNLNKILDQYESILGSSSIQLFELLRGLPFYNWPKEITDKCMSEKDNSKIKEIFPLFPQVLPVADFNHAID